MRVRIAALLLALTAMPALAQVAPGPQQRVSGPVDTDAYRTIYIRLKSRDSDGLLYEPVATGPKAGIALVFSHPSGNVFTDRVAPEMAIRGYRVMMVNYHGDKDSDDAYLPGISQAIDYLRTLPEVRRVVVVGHSGGGHLIPLYVNVAENGPEACSGPEKIYPCPTGPLTGLAKPDAMVLLDPTLGAFHQMSSIDPAVSDMSGTRDPALDMFSPANGYDRANKRASYSPAFSRRFYAAQAARGRKLVDAALARLKAIDAGAGQFSDDEPFTVPGMGVNVTGARLYQPDISIVSHTKRPHLLLRADGTRGEQVIHSVRGPSGERSVESLRSLDAMAQNTTVRRFLAASAIRTLPGYAITADDITGVDWRSSFMSSPGNAEGITVPTLILSMGCHYLLVPGEIIFDHLAAKDKSFAVVEGATHGFAPCKPDYGDTVKRSFDFVDEWLSRPGRFQTPDS